MSYDCLFQYFISLIELFYNRSDTNIWKKILKTNSLILVLVLVYAYVELYICISIRPTCLIHINKGNFLTKTLDFSEGYKTINREINFLHRFFNSKSGYVLCGEKTLTIIVLFTVAYYKD